MTALARGLRRTSIIVSERASRLAAVARWSEPISRIVCALPPVGPASGALTSLAEVDARLRLEDARGRVQLVGADGDDAAGEAGEDDRARGQQAAERAAVGGRRGHRGFSVRVGATRRSLSPYTGRST